MTKDEVAAYRASILHGQEVAKAIAPDVAELYKVVFDAFIAKGFERPEAIQLALEYVGQGFISHDSPKV
jgi:hypothetical protein